MKLKEPPQTVGVPISTFLLHRKRYKIDRTYQREVGTWRKLDEQYFIDTILRGFGMPPIFLHKGRGHYFIVDGQQRLNTIWKFKDNKLNLSDRYSSKIINDIKNKEKNKGKGALNYRELHPEWQNRFDRYQLPVTYLEGYNDEEIRDLFRRLQHGKPLVAGEILNAYPGNIVFVMRDIAKHKFFTKIASIGIKRYKHFYLVATFLYLASEGIREVKPSKVYDFFEDNKNAGKGSKDSRKVKKVLNYLTDVFHTKTPELRKPAWVITTFLLISGLVNNYVMGNQKNNFKKFFLEFYKKVIDSSKTRGSKLSKFYDALSVKNNDRAMIQLRHGIILKRFLGRYNPDRLDENRLFTKAQKITIFRRDREKCRICGKKLTFGSRGTHFHHKDKYIMGGRTEIDKGLLVCRACHFNKIHGVRGKYD